MNAVRERAFAKINLFLDVLSRREDGFHNIKSIMHTVSLCDDVTVYLNSYGKKSIKMLLSGNKRLPTDSRNIAYLAAELFLDRAAIDADITVNLNKRIPVCAGLGGGSADAAAVLRALNKLFRRPFTDKALLSMAQSLGSDVPFCLLGGTALCLGKGEEITRFPNGLRLNIVIAVGKEYVSTPEAYAALDGLYSNFDGSISTGGNKEYCDIEDWITRGGEPRGLYNVFESVVLPVCNQAFLIKEQMLSLGAEACLMSGSGPSVFGIFKSEEDAKKAERLLLENGVSAFFCHTIKF